MGRLLDGGGGERRGGGGGCFMVGEGRAWEGHTTSFQQCLQARLVCKQQNQHTQQP